MDLGKSLKQSCQTLWNNFISGNQKEVQNVLQKIKEQEAEYFLQNLTLKKDKEVNFGNKLRVEDD